MRLSEIGLRRVRLPLVVPFRTALETETHREVLLVQVRGPDGAGWGECAAFTTPHYSPETLAGAHKALRESLIPLVDPDHVSVEEIEQAMAPVKGHPMAKAALESAIWDAELRNVGRSLADRLGATRTRVPDGVAVGMMGSIPELLDAVGAYLDLGYLRVKLKIQPGWDLAPVQAVRRQFGDVPLQVDANMAYSMADHDHLAGFDEFDLLMIEQPLARDDLESHAKLAGQIQTPICLDESITSTEAAVTAIELGACSVINIKPGRVGGLLEAVRLHDFCVDNGIPAWCGGMLESGIGRAANLALAALPGFTLVGDLSASSRYYNQDITPPFELDNGHIAVPTGPGIGVEPIGEVLEQMTISTELIAL